MAGAGYKLFNTGDVLTAAQVNTYLQEQVVMRFANATARTTALSGVLAEGMMSYLDDTNSVEVYNGSAWVNIGSTGDITGVTAGTGISGGGTSGDVTITNSMATAIDAKGDLIVGTGADTFSRLAVGTNGHTLVADSSTATGLKWSAPAGGGGMTFISRTTFSNVATQNFTDVFTTNHSVYCVYFEGLGAATGSDDFYLRFRKDNTTNTGAYYSTSLEILYNSGTLAVTNAVANAAFLTDYMENNWGTLYFVNVAQNSRYSAYYGQIYGVGDSNLREVGGMIATPDNWDGFTLLSSSSNISGTVTIFGVNQS